MTAAAGHRSNSSASPNSTFVSHSAISVVMISRACSANTITTVCFDPSSIPKSVTSTSGSSSPLDSSRCRVKRSRLGYRSAAASK